MDTPHLRCSVIHKQCRKINKHDKYKLKLSLYYMGSVKFHRVIVKIYAERLIFKSDCPPAYGLF